MNRHLIKALNIQGKINRLDLQKQACFRKYLAGTPYQKGQRIPCEGFSYQGKEMEITDVKIHISRDIFSGADQFHLIVTGNIICDITDSPGDEKYSFDRKL